MNRIFPILDRPRLVKKRGKDERPLPERGHSYRNYTPEEFFEYSLDEEGNLDESRYMEARKTFRRMEGGRFHPMVDKVSLMFSKLDPDEKELFAEKNPGLIKWVGIHGFLEELDTQEKYSGVPTVYEFREVEDEW